MRLWLAIWLVGSMATWAGMPRIYNEMEYARQEDEKVAVTNARDATSNCVSNLADVRVRLEAVRGGLTNLVPTVWTAGAQRTYQVNQKQAISDLALATRDLAQAVRDQTEALRELLRIQAGRP